MTVVKTYHVTCDWDRCHNQIYGSTAIARRSESASRRARATASKRGWRRRRIEGRWHDLCPAHVVLEARTR